MLATVVLLLLTAAASVEAQPAEAVLVGSNGAFFATEDFETFTKIPVSGDFRDIAYGEDGSGNDMWIAVRAGGMVASSDGYDWDDIWNDPADPAKDDFAADPNNPTTKADNNLWSIKYGGGQWMVTTGSWTETCVPLTGPCQGEAWGAVYQSTDGRTWTSLSLPSGAQTRVIKNTAWGDTGGPQGTWVARMQSCYTHYCGGRTVMKSTDGGATWTDPVSVPFASTNGVPGRALAYGVDSLGNPKWMAGVAYGTGQSGLYTSPDGLTWNVETTGLCSKYDTNVAHDGFDTWVGVIMTGFNDGANPCARRLSDGGGAWTAASIPAADVFGSYAPAYHPASHTWILGGSRTSSGLDGTLLSRDAGATWIHPTNPPDPATTAGYGISSVAVRTEPPNPADLTKTNMTAIPTAVPADGMTAANIVVELRDAAAKRTPAHPYYDFDYEVNLTTDFGTFSNGETYQSLTVSETGDGTFRTTLNSTMVGVANITAKIRNGTEPWIPITDPAILEVEFFPTPDPARTIITSNRIQVNATLPANVTVTTFDYEGNLYVDEDHDAGDANHDHNVTVVETEPIAPGTRTLSGTPPGAAAYYGDGNYSVTLGCSTNATVRLSAKIDYSYSAGATDIDDEVNVECIDGPVASAELTTITSDKDEIQADGIDNTTIRVQIVGELGDVITYDWYRVCLNTTIGILSSDSDPDQSACPMGYVNATYNPLDRDYTAKLNGTEGGFATIQGLLDGKAIGDDDTTVELLGGVPRVEDDPQYETRFGVLLDVGKTMGVLVNDEDPRPEATGDPLVDLTAENLTQPSNAAFFEFHENGSFQYLPSPGFNGTVSFTYRALNDADEASNDEATVTITVLENEAPTIQDDEYTVDFGTTLNVPELLGVFYDGADDEDPEGADLEAHLVSGPVNGSLILEQNGSFAYTPDSPYAAGTDSFTYNVTDGYAWAGPATVQITISPNVAPTAQDDTYSTAFETTLVVPHTSHNYKDVLDNDEDDTPEDVTLTVVTADTGQRDTAKGGNVTLNADGSFTYKPRDLLENEDDWFWYNATDGYDESMAKVTINVAASGNNPPEALDDGVYETAFGTQLIVAAADGVRDGDLQAAPKDGDPDGDTIDVVAQVSSPTDQGGTVTLNADGSFTYTPPAPPFSGLDNFTYKVSDGYLESNAANVMIRVKENTPPTAQDDGPYNADYGLPLVIDVSDGDVGVLANDDDPEDLFLEAVAETVATDRGGLATITSDGSFTYTPPDPPAAGLDNFTYQAWDGFDGSRAKVTIDVAENRAPIAVDDSASVQEDGSVDIDVVTGSDTDPDPNHSAADLKVVAVSTPSPHGTAEILPDNRTIRYEPGQDRNETATFTYTIKDPAGATATATVEVTIVDVNDAPVANPDGPYHVQQPATLTVAARGVLANDDDIDNEQRDLTAVPVSEPPGFTLHSNGGFTYEPPGGFTGRTAFEYQACDPNGACSNHITVLLDVQAPPPRATTAQNEPEPPKAPDVPKTWFEVKAGAEVFIPTGIRPSSGSNALLVWTQATGPEITLVWDAERGGYVFTAPMPQPGASMELVYLIAVRDGSRVSDAVEVTVHVDSENTEPVARAEARPSRVVAGQEVLLDASESYDPDGQALSFHWQRISGPHVDLQDEDRPVASFLAPRVDDDAGPLVFVVVVSDAGGKHALANVTVTYVQSLTQEATTAVIDADFRALQRGQGQILFRATGSDAAHYVWDLGDGKTATGPEYLHRYEEGGDFNVKLTVEDNEGTGSAEKPVSVPDYVPVQEAKSVGVGWWVLGAAVAVSLLVIAVVALVALRSRK